MRSSGMYFLLLLVLLLLVLNGCWIPLPEETAIVVQILSGADPAGTPVNDVSVVIDGSTLVTGAAGTDGQAFKSLGISGDHTLAVDTDSLTDPQGGIRYVLAGSHISGEAQDGIMVAYAGRGFALADTAMTVPVKEGFITVVTVYVSELLASPADNQWLTDGVGSSPYISSSTAEFASTIMPTFWWREEPSLGGTVSFTFQLWEDDDGDTRYPLGVADTTNYSAAMSASSSSYVQPDWQVPLAGLQRADAASTSGQVNLWWGAASDASAFSYDIYYAPSTLWVSGDWENNYVLRGVVTGTDDGSAKTAQLGPGSSNPAALFKNGIEYTFGLKARDASSNLDTTGATAQRTAVSAGSSLTWSSTTLTATADSTLGGQVTLSFAGSAPSVTGTTTYRIYAAPASDFSFHEGLIRASTTTPGTVVLTGLMNGLSYKFGIEPIDSGGNYAAGLSATATPTSSSAADTTAPTFAAGSGSFTASTNGSVGQVAITFTDIASDASTVNYRIYYAPTALSVTDLEAMSFSDIAAFGSTPFVKTLTGFINGVNYRFGIRAYDSFGNYVEGATPTTLTPDSATADTTGPTWSTNTQALFSSLSWSSGSTVYPIGWTFPYNGFALGQDPANGQGEYVWRVTQDDGTTSFSSKLGAFYAYSGYYYFSTDSSSLQMTAPSSNVDHQRVLSFMEASLPAGTVMGSPIDSNLTAAFKQRPASAFATSLADTAAIDPDTVNQMVIRYQTNSDGEAVVQEASPSGFIGILKVLAANRTTNLASIPPYLQYKEFQEWYWNRTSPPNDDLVDLFITGNFTYPVIFSGNLTTADYQDPEL